RSQVKDGDLLVKITGVGRMAIASVAPKDFVGNTNQHMVVIRTGDRVVSEYLASYLNLDIVEKLATRRATGATRPALDYPALKSIPIVENVDFSILENAQIEKSKKDAEANILIASIDKYLLDKLEIQIPNFKNKLQNRIFFSSANEITGNRFDPKLYSAETKAIKNAILNGSYGTVHLSDYIIQSYAGDWGKEDSGIPIENHTKCLVIRATEFDNIFNLKLDNTRVKYRYINSEKLKKIDLQSGDLLIEKSGGSIDQPVGRISILRDDIISDNTLCYSNFIHKIRVDSNEFNPEYLFAYLKTIHSIGLTEAMQSQTNGIRNLIMRTYFKQQIPKPSITIQNEIADEIMSIRLRAKNKLAEAESILETAKQEIEKQLLA
ncbi:MAG: restriction endonuclease subunit S, partial [Bacteroidetes bacterium]|nr:restriction endonuclease subunit S [Bacteroidota bacterium]